MLKKYEECKIERRTAEEVLGIKRAQFFRLLSKYRSNKEEFSIDYGRDYTNRVFDKKTDEIIRSGLEQDRQYIENPAIPIWRYNYSEIGREISREYGIGISTQTIINRAKKWRYYKQQLIFVLTAMLFKMSFKNQNRTV